jgi:hypothetical protein
MVHAELQKKKKNEEADVWVVTCEGEKKEEKFEHGEGSSKKNRGKY